MTVGSQLLETVEGATIELTCSSDGEINTCIFTNPENRLLDARAPGASYGDGRIGVMEIQPGLCGLKITGVEQEDFGAWR